MEGLVVSSETLAAAPALHDLRAKKGLPPIQLLVSQRENAATLSSTFLRERASRPEDSAPNEGGGT